MLPRSELDFIVLHIGYLLFIYTIIESDYYYTFLLMYRFMRQLLVGLITPNKKKKRNNLEDIRAI